MNIDTGSIVARREAARRHTELLRRRTEARRALGRAERGQDFTQAGHVRAYLTRLDKEIQNAAQAARGK